MEEQTQTTKGLARQLRDARQAVAKLIRLLKWAEFNLTQDARQSEYYLEIKKTLRG